MDVAPLEYALLALAVLVGVLVLSLAVRVLVNRDALPTLVLTEFRVSKSPLNGIYVLLAGRPAGLWGLFMSVIGMGKRVRFEVTRSAVQRESQGVLWYEIDSVPLTNVGSTSYGHSRSTLYLFLAFFLLSCGVVGFPMTALPRVPNDARPFIAILSGTLVVLGLVFLLGFYLSKRLFIEVETGGGAIIGVRFKPSVIEHLNVDLEEASGAVQIINALIAK